MGWNDFNQTEFTCAVCGARFKAMLGKGVRAPAITYCGDCGLKYSPEKLKQLAARRRMPSR